jgi:uncharacterized membrane protein YcaP (DUF421 family)
MNVFFSLSDVIIRSCISVTVLFILTRLMGKKQISQLTFFDYAVGITIGSIASQLSVDSHISYINGITSLVVWALFAVILSFLSLKSNNISKLLNGTPTIIIQNGVLMEQEMRKSKFTIDDILEELRLNGVFDIADVDYAILETSGRVSVLLKPQKQQTTLGDLNIVIPPKGLTANLILDGKLQSENLKLIQIDEIWLKGELKKQGINSYSEVLLACTNKSKLLYVIPRDKDIKPLNVF